MLYGSVRSSYCGYYGGLLLIIAIIINSYLTNMATASSHWLPFDSKMASDSPIVHIETSRPKAHTLEIQLNIGGAYTTKITTEGVLYDKISIPKEGYLTQVGRPQLPIINRYFAIPKGMVIKARITEASFRDIKGYLIYPAQKPDPEIEGIVRAFKIDTELYRREGFFPKKTLLINKPITIRGLRAAILKVVPVRFHPSKGILRVYSKIRIELTFEPDDQWRGSPTGLEPPKRLREAGFESTFNRLLMANSFSAYPHSGGGSAWRMANLADPGGLLIIAPEAFLEAARTLAAWKIRKGLPTTVKTVESLGKTAEDIKSYIKNAYHAWSNPPTYLLFIGDAEFIPPFYQTVHPIDDSLVGTDLYYGTLDGDDYFPDIAIGRFSVDTLEEAKRRVNDIIAYEHGPTHQESYYKKVALCAEFQHDRDGYASRRFTQTAEDLAIFFTDSEYLNRYQVDRIYYTHPNVTPLFWSTRWFGGGPAGNPGDPIPAYLKRPSFGWGGNHHQISRAINEGRFLIIHRDHGTTEEWKKPHFTSHHVRQLQNGVKLPVVWSINCLTGWFDNETDSKNSTGALDLSFTEQWERNPDGGAIGIIASTRTSYSGANDRIVWGLTDAIWPSFLSASNATNVMRKPITTMGQVLNYAKYYLAQTFEDDDTRKLEFEMFHWFGDPSMSIWTKFPETLGVYHPLKFRDNTSIEIDVDQKDALIAITHKGKILARTLSVKGSNKITWQTPLTSKDEIDIVVTKPNFYPYEGRGVLSAFTINIPKEAKEGDGIISGAGLAELDEILNHDLKITLSSSNPAKVLFNPSEITIKAGSQYAPFDLIILDDSLLSGSESVAAIATTDEFGVFVAKIAIHDNDPADINLEIPTEAKEHEGDVTGKVRISRKADSDIRIRLVSSNPNKVGLDDFITIPKGADEAVFNLRVIDNDLIDGDQTLNIEASVAGWRVARHLFEVIDNENYKLSLSAPLKVYETDGVLIQGGEVVISGRFHRDIPIRLSLSDDSEVKVPKEIVIKKGQVATRFDIEVINDNRIDKTQNITIKAMAEGWHSDSFDTTVYDIPTIPYLEDFATATLPPKRGWKFYSSNSYGRIQIKEQKLAMDVASYNSALNEAILSVNLNGYQKVILSFFQAEFQERIHNLEDSFIGHCNGDGVAISNDGTTWYTILNASDLSSGSMGHQFDIDLDRHVKRIRDDFDSSFGYNSNFKIKFQQYDFGSYPLSGRNWDNIAVTGVSPIRVSLPREVIESDQLIEGGGSVSIEALMPHDITITLTSSDPTKISVPKKVILNQGTKKGTFDFKIHDDNLLLGSHPVHIIAHLEGVGDGIETVTVIDNETAKLSLIVPGSFLENSGFVKNSATLRLNKKVDGDVAVKLSSSSGTDVMLPAMVIVPKNQDEVQFGIDIVNNSRIDGDRIVTINAQVRGWKAGIGEVLILDDEHRKLTIEIKPFHSALSEGEAHIKQVGSVNISGTINRDLKVTLTSNDHSELMVEREIIIPKGQKQASFGVTVIDDEDYDGSQNVAIKALADGFMGCEKTIKIKDDDLHHFSFAKPLGPFVIANSAISIEILSKDINDETIYRYSGKAILGDQNKELTVEPSTIEFKYGRWNDTIRIGNLKKDAVLVVDDAKGHRGISNSFSVVTGPIDHFSFGKISQTQRSNQPFEITITAKDFNGYAISDFEGSATVSGWRRTQDSLATIVITEISLGNPDYIEIANVTKERVFTEGWRVVVNGKYTDINDVNKIHWNLGPYIDKSGILYRSDAKNDNYWGNNILWQPWAGGWAIILDDKFKVIDAVFWGWKTQDIEALELNILGVKVDGLGDAFTTDGIDLPTNNGHYLLRVGNDDTNTANDFTISNLPSKGFANRNLEVFFGQYQEIPIGLGLRKIELKNGLWSGKLTLQQEGEVLLRVEDENGHYGISNLFKVLAISEGK